MPNEPNSRSSKTEHRVVTAQRVSTRRHRNRDKRSGSLVRSQRRLVSSRWSKEEGAGDARDAQNEASIPARWPGMVVSGKQPVDRGGRSQLRFSGAKKVGYYFRSTRVFCEEDEDERSGGKDQDQD